MDMPVYFLYLKPAIKKETDTSCNQSRAIFPVLLHLWAVHKSSYENRLYE